MRFGGSNGAVGGANGYIQLLSSHEERNAASFSRGGLVQFCVGGLVVYESILDISSMFTRALFQQASQLIFGAVNLGNLALCLSYIVAVYKALAVVFQAFQMADFLRGIVLFFQVSVLTGRLQTFG